MISSNAWNDTFIQSVISFSYFTYIILMAIYLMASTPMLLGHNRNKIKSTFSYSHDFQSKDIHLCFNYGQHRYYWILTFSFFILYFIYVFCHLNCMISSCLYTGVCCNLIISFLFPTDIWVCFILYINFYY